MTTAGVLITLGAGMVLAWAVAPGYQVGALRGAASPRGRPSLARKGAVPPKIRALAGVAVAIIAVGLVPGVAGWVLAPLLGGATYLVTRRIEPHAAVVRREQLALQLPHTLDLLVAAIQAGAPLRSATESVAAVAFEPTAEMLTGILDLIRVGSSDAEAWRSLSDDPVWGSTARDIARSVESGTALAEVLSIQSGEARRLRRLLLAGGAKTAGVKAVLPLVCCYLPAFILVGVVPIIAGSFGQFLRP